jgi:hypothetical protein
MIIVTGTKRSGTSMWMQILRAAGYEIVGEAFPENWGETIRAANPRGFYESHLRRGIYYATNPNPRSGEYLCPSATAHTVVKVFAPGVVRSDLAFVHRVLATMRPWAEYAASVERLYTMERDGQRALRPKRRAQGREPELIPAFLAWWSENYGLLRDALVRRYPLYWTSYASVLSAPAETIERVLAFLGGGRLEPALSQVRSQLRTQHAATRRASGAGRDIEAVADELYARVHAEVPLDARFLEQLHRTNARLAPAIRDAQARVRERRRGAVSSSGGVRGGELRPRGGPASL